jgi:DNA-binding LytR/AlgR family response regulator
LVIVASCDDDAKICAEIESALIDIFGKLNVSHEIDVFFSGEELCRNMEQGAHYDLIFLDIAFAENEINGVEVGKLIRESHQNYTTSIVYISWEKNYALQLFEIQPLNFLIKPVEYEKIEETIRMYMKTAGLLSGVFTYKKGQDTFKVRIKDIVYLESRDRKLILHLADDRTEEFYGSIKEAYTEQLKRFDFLFTHNSYVVNYDYITALKFNQVLLANDETPLPISKHRRNEVREIYYEIMKRRTV